MTLPLTLGNPPIKSIDIYLTKHAWELAMVAATLQEPRSHSYFIGRCHVTLHHKGLDILLHTLPIQNTCNPFESSEVTAMSPQRRFM